MADQEYILGTHDEEVDRLGLQHRVWRARTLECWAKAGITAGSRVLDVGAGPGFATTDLAEIVGPSGHVMAVERSERFIAIGRARLSALGIQHVTYTQGDVMIDPLPRGLFDVAWVRWVFCFLNDPEALVQKIANSLKPGGRLAIHEYVDYATWRSIPQKPAIEEFVSAAMRSWRVAGGEPDIARRLPEWLSKAGLSIVHVEPMSFIMRPQDYAWGWPQAFILNQADRLAEGGYLTQETADQAKRDLADLTGDPNSMMISPLTLEIIAEKR